MEFSIEDSGRFLPILSVAESGFVIGGVIVAVERIVNWRRGRQRFVSFDCLVHPRLVSFHSSVDAEMAGFAAIREAERSDSGEIVLARSFVEAGKRAARIAAATVQSRLGRISGAHVRIFVQQFVPNSSRATFVETHDRNFSVFEMVRQFRVFRIAGCVAPAGNETFRSGFWDSSAAETNWLFIVFVFDFSSQFEKRNVVVSNVLETVFRIRDDFFKKEARSVRVLVVDVFVVVVELVHSNDDRPVVTGIVVVDHVARFFNAVRGRDDPLVVDDRAAAEMFPFALSPAAIFAAFVLQRHLPRPFAVHRLLAAVNSEVDLRRSLSASRHHSACCFGHRFDRFDRNIARRVVATARDVLISFAFCRIDVFLRDLIDAASEAELNSIAARDVALAVVKSSPRECFFSRTSVSVASHFSLSRSVLAKATIDDVTCSFSEALTGRKGDSTAARSRAGIVFERSPVVLKLSAATFRLKNRLN